MRFVTLSHHGAPAPPGVSDVAGAWTLDPGALLVVASLAAVYVWCTRRVRTWPAARTAAFLGGLAVLFVALTGPPDTYATESLTAHMTQHLLMTMVAAPLLLLGAPMTLWLRAAAPEMRRFLSSVMNSKVVHFAGNPLVGWLAFSAALWFTHLTGFYDLALRNESAHLLEHVLYLTTALMFWYPIVSLGPGARRLPFPLRLVYLMLALPMSVFLALVIYSSTEVMYPTYRQLAASWGVSPLDDQRVGAMVMWFAGEPVIVAAIAATFFAWARQDRKEAARADRAAALDIPRL